MVLVPVAFSSFPYYVLLRFVLFVYFFQVLPVRVMGIFFNIFFRVGISGKKQHTPERFQMEKYFNLLFLLILFFFFFTVLHGVVDFVFVFCISPAEKHVNSLCKLPFFPVSCLSFLSGLKRKSTIDLPIFH